MLTMLVLHNMVCKADAVRKGVITFPASALNTCSVVKLVAETPELPVHEPQKWRVSVLTKGNAFHSNALLGCVMEQVCNCTSLGVGSQTGHLVLGDVCLA